MSIEDFKCTSYLELCINYGYGTKVRNDHLSVLYFIERNSDIIKNYMRYVIIDNIVKTGAVASLRSNT